MADEASTLGTSWSRRRSSIAANDAVALTQDAAHLVLQLVVRTIERAERSCALLQDRREVVVFGGGWPRAVTSPLVATASRARLAAASARTPSYRAFQSSSRRWSMAAASMPSLVDSRTADDKNQPRPTYKAFSEGSDNVSTASQRLCTDHGISHDDVAGDRSRYALASASGDLDAVRHARVDAAGEPLVMAWSSEHSDDAAGRAHCDVAYDEMERIADKESSAFKKKRNQLAKDLVNRQQWAWIFRPPDSLVEDVVRRRGL
jgi:hypothetical protein